MSLLPPILVIDENPDDSALVSLVVKGAFGEVEIEQVGDAAGLVRVLTDRRFGVVLAEYRLSWISGSELVDLVRQRLPEAAIVVMNAQESAALAAEVTRAGVHGFTVKSASGLAHLDDVIREALLRVRRQMAGVKPETRQLLDGLPVGVFVADADGVLLDVNPGLATLLGFQKPAQLVNRHFHRFLVGPSVAQDFKAAIKGGPSAIDLEAELEQRDGERMWAHICLWPAAPTSGSPTRFHGLVENIGHYRHALIELESRSSDLERSNRDLEEMAYVVSHDLQQPLGVITRSLDLLGEDGENGLDEEGRDLISHAKRGAAALERMLEAIVGYARVDSSGSEFTPVDLQGVLERVLDLLKDQISDSGAKITVDLLPTIIGDEAQMERLFQNLLSNALKFSGPTPPRIEIGATEQENCWLLSIRDHGIGIDPNALDRIFKMFQRLHTQEEIPGTGIGLAVCRRIVTRHGGEIWVESRPGEGTTFHITIPHRDWKFQ